MPRGAPAEERGAERRVRQQRSGLAGVAIAALGENIAAVGGAQRGLGVLLDHEHGNVPFGEPPEIGKNLGDDLRREPCGRLIEQDDAGIRHQCAGDRQHLPLTARQHARLLAAFGREVGKGIEGTRKAVGKPGRDGVAADDQVLLHGQRREDIAGLWNEGEPAPDQRVGRQAA